MQISLPGTLWQLLLGLAMLVAAVSILAHWAIPEPVLVIYLFVEGILILINR